MENGFGGPDESDEIDIRVVGLAEGIIVDGLLTCVVGSLQQQSERTKVESFT